MWLLFFAILKQWNIIMKTEKTITQRNYSWIFYLIPALFFYTIFMAYPLLDSLRMSFFSDQSVMNPSKFIGLKNYITLFTNGETATRYWSAFRNTWYFFFIHMAVQNVFGLCFAYILIDKVIKGRKFFQTVIFIPATLAVLVTGYLWKLILNPQWGAITILLNKLKFTDFATSLLGDPQYALTVISLVSSWQWIGLPTIIFIAAMNNISDDIFEAARIDGASKFIIFYRIVIPMIKPIIGVVTILTFVGNFNAFDVIFAMAGVNGAPLYSTDILGTLFYRVGIAGQHPVGIPYPSMGAAIATITFLVLMLGMLVVFKLTRGENK